MRSTHLRLLSLCALLIMFTLRALAAVRVRWPPRRVSACTLLLRVSHNLSEREIGRKLEERLHEKGGNCQVLNVNKIYLIGDGVRAVRRLALCRKRLRQAQLNGAAASRLEELRLAVMQAKNAVNEQVEAFRGEKGESEVFSGKAFAVFASSTQRDAAARALRHLPWAAESEYGAREAAEPNEYDWVNFHRPTPRDWMALGRVAGSVALVTCCTALLLLALSQLRHAIKRIAPPGLLRYGFLAVAAFMISASNSLLVRVLKVALRQWRSPLFDAAAAHRFLCTAACIWLNTTLSVSALGLIVYWRRNYACVWKDRGVATVVTATLLVEVLGFAEALLDPRYLRRRRRLDALRRAVAQGGFDNTQLQCELNEAAEKVHYDAVGEHARLFALAGLALFFQLAAPYASLLALVAAGLRVAAQGWILRHRALRLQELGPHFSNATLIAFDACFILYGAGFFVFQRSVRAPLLGGALTLGGAVALTTVGRLAAWLRPQREQACDVPHAAAYVETNPVAVAFADEERAARGFFASQRLHALRRALTAYALQRYRWGHGAKNIYPIDLNEALSPEDAPVADEGVLRLFTAPRDEELGRRRRSSQDFVAVVSPDARRSRSAQPKRV